MSIGAVMARPKKKATARASKPLKTIGFKATAQWAEWLDKAARHFRTTNAGLIDRALAEWTAERGFGDPPPERIP